MHGFIAKWALPASRAEIMSAEAVPHFCDACEFAKFKTSGNVGTGREVESPTPRLPDYGPESSQKGGFPAFPGIRAGINHLAILKLCA
jgi:hypothetical protein